MAQQVIDHDDDVINKENFKYDIYIKRANFVLGEGAFGRVTSCTNINDKEIAVKTIQCDDDPDDILQEIEILKTLSNHPYIIKLLAYSIEDDMIYLYLELAIMDISTYLKSKYGILPNKKKDDKKEENQNDDEKNDKENTNIDKRKEMYLEIRYIAMCIFKALKYMHSQNIAHRDIKGENVLIACSGTVQLSDVGLAKCFTDAALETNVGTAVFMAPEVTLQAVEQYTSICDIWSAGVTLFEALSIKRIRSELFSKYGLNNDDVTDNDIIAMYKEFINKIDEEIKHEINDKIIDTIIRACCQFKPDDRPKADEILKVYFSDKNLCQQLEEIKEKRLSIIANKWMLLRMESKHNNYMICECGGPCIPFKLKDMKKKYNKVYDTGALCDGCEEDIDNNNMWMYHCDNKDSHKGHNFDLCQKCCDERKCGLKALNVSLYDNKNT